MDSKGPGTEEALGAVASPRGRPGVQHLHRTASGVAGCALPRRRNGKQQACEPCRKAKIACDHALPVCDRCKRRKVVSRCVYLSAPMTRPVPDGRTRSEPAIASVIGIGNLITHGDAEMTMPPTPSTGSGSSPLAGAGVRPGGSPQGLVRSGMSGSVRGEEMSKDVGSEATRTEPKPTPESGPFIKSGGFFGPTNFSAVFMENASNLGNDDIQITSVSTEPYVPSYESLQSQTFLMLAGKEQRGSPRVALGVKILQALPDPHTCKFLLEWYFEKGHECAYPKQSIMYLANSIWTTYGPHLNEPRLADELEHVSSILCKNAEKPLEEHEDYESYVTSCSGANLRWESLGGVFGALTTAILSLPERDAFFTTQRGDRRNRRHFSVEMKDCVQACITLSNYMDLINVPMVALLVKNLILQTVISGDASLVVWRQLGDLVSATTALGLHRQIDTPARPPSFLSETKKRIFTFIFNIDKGSALLTGRPPALSYQYTRFKFPLDLSEEVLMKGGEEMTREIERLDPEGWNVDGNIYPSTQARAHGMLALILNEVLELSLGDPENCTGERIKYLLSRVEKNYASYPASLHFHLSDLSNPNVSDRIFWRRLCVRLLMLEHRLLLERLAHKSGSLDGQSMVDCAREMLELTVLLWVQRDRFVEHHHDYDWMLMCWGVPSSGVLCVELLKQAREGDTALRLPRSEIVQNLSLLIGFLEWVKPAAGNYQLCKRMRLIIKRILDQILNPREELGASAQPTTSSSSCSSQESTLTTGNEHTAEEKASRNGSTGTNGGMVGVQQQQQQQQHGQPFEPTMFDGTGAAGGMMEEGTDDFDWLNTVDWSRGPWFDLGQDFSAARWG